MVLPNCNRKASDEFVINAIRPGFPPGRGIASGKFRPSASWFIGLWLPLLLFCPSAWCAVQPPHAPPVVRHGYRSDRILVKPKAGLELNTLSAFHRQHGTRLLRTFSDLEQVQVIEIQSGNSVPEIIAAYLKSGLVEYAEPDIWCHADLVPQDPKFLDGTLWHLKNIGLNGADIDATAGWNIQNTATNVIVAIIDSGIRYTHEDLASNLWVNPNEIAGNGLDDDHDGFVDDLYGINAVLNNGDPDDDFGHGTHVAGIIGAVGNNQKGVVGVAWRVQLMACKFLDNTGNGSISDAIVCFDYARSKGASIINASWGADAYSSTLRLAIQRTRDAGIVVVTAAGNEGTNNDVVPSYPGNYDVDNLVSVAATTSSDTLASFSNYGATTVDLAAPGSFIYSTWNSADNDYAYSSGTSMAAPCVAGVFALVRARFSNYTYQQLISRVLTNTDLLPALAGKCITGGRVNLRKALGPSLIADFSASSLSGAVPVTVAFTNLSVGAIGSYQWDFGDGSTSTNVNPSHTFAIEGNFSVTLTVTGVNNETASQTLGVAAIANYQPAGTPFDWIDPSNMTLLPLTDNGVSSAQTLPFIFTFYGQSYEQLYVGANGIIGFISSPGLAITSNLDMPKTNAPNAIICPYWDNLNPASAGSVRIGVVGEAPDRRVVVSWIGVPRNSTPSTLMTFQAVLGEEPQQILFQYLEVNPANNRGGGKGATIGLKNETGIVAAKYTFDGNPALVTNRQALIFLPTSAGGLVVSPTRNLTAVGERTGPFSPPTLTYTLVNQSADAIHWQATHSQSWLTLSATNGLLEAHASTNLTAAINDQANTLAMGSYYDRLSCINLDTGRGNATRTVTLNVNGIIGILSVTPTVDFIAEGLTGGPFSSANQVYALTNAGDAPLSWTLGKGQFWLSVSAVSGNLNAGDQTNVAVTLNTNAANLSPSVYNDTLSFANTTSGRGNTQHHVVLTVLQPIAPTLGILTYEAALPIHLYLIGDKNRIYRLEGSTNLLDWVPVATNTTTPAGAVDLFDPAATPLNQRFYRALTP